MKWNEIKSYFEISLAMVFWAASFIWYKEAYEFLGPMTLIFFRMITSSIFLFLLILLMHRLERIRKQDIKYFLLLALVEPLLYFLGESHGMLYVSSTVGAVIVSTIPLFVPFAARFFYRASVNQGIIPAVCPDIGGKVFRPVGRILIPAKLDGSMNAHLPLAVIQGPQMFFLDPVKTSPGIVKG